MTINQTAVLANGTKTECLERANHFLEVGIRQEAKWLAEGGEGNAPPTVEMAIKQACKYEDAGFDGRA